MQFSKPRTYGYCGAIIFSASQQMTLAGGNMRTLRLLAFVVVVFLAQTPVAQPMQPAAIMFGAAQTFLATLDSDQRAKALLPFNSDERFRWFYTPVSRKGIPLKEPDASQKQAALALLRAGLSEKGYTKAETIRKLEKVLRELSDDFAQR
jgi:hypothetical protein